MITDRDISKLKTVFATKDDLTPFATKEELAGVRTELVQRFDGVDMRMDRIEYKISSMDDRMDAMDEKMDHVMVTVDGIAGKLDTLMLENAAGGQVLARNTRQIEALAKHTGTKLPD